MPGYNLYFTNKVHFRVQLSNLLLTFLQFHSCSGQHWNWMLKVWFRALSFVLISHPSILKHASPLIRTQQQNCFSESNHPHQKKRERGKHSFKKERCKRILCAHFQNLKGKMQCKYWQFQLFYPSNVLSALMINDVLFVFCGLFGDFCLFLVMMKISANKQLQHGRCKTRHFWGCPIYL